ncbi:E3 ubiquitin-protein ligase MARCH6 [Orussus abietinus]|uniref:E3 ubiquitin-protein ligase MARCH6 n=1 Tax=Orussus abietinus TaxID=222816 RepID=UPI000626284F|nr:E3 ubiquitin-protein ligase MARCH6 [Orussus abietinus]XP_012271650.1 E3 ubiquitin-protein ligase MARCH6 [Orussus abietinus]XP_012271651.1 E3 ubiquitin-protein ligase MARCH6 [Orussus abietinus]XP_012271652.1 E3 ubiquitin-protein ligase MARCH6 [Orussus abietinus]XP_012271653.1 E3 ubiquitin-protein ligase MARCH6 [Orussus abietinus]XP_023287701.1 E3 ubiquitin-protein ligase MARCH6 [Orussus abietinus]
MTEDMLGADICRVCQAEGLSDRPLFHPCICTGSIKWIHQECLLQWMRYSRKEYCELCGYRFSFMPVYSPDMPRRLPLKDVVKGLLSSVLTAVKYWFHYTVVAIAWLGIVPLSACRTYRVLFGGSLNLVRIMSLPMEVFSLENVSSDVFQGCFVVTCTLFSFIGLVWLREQILHAGGPDWLERDNVQLPPAENRLQPEANVPRVQEDHAFQVPEAQDNNNVPPFIEEPPVRSEEPNLIDGPNRGLIDEGASPSREGGEDLGADPLLVGTPEGPNRQGNASPPRDEPGIHAAQGQLPADGGWRGQAQGPGQGQAEEANWNPMEWDRPADELTWERLLGLDGSLVFLEHIFWVVSLNALFILLFAFCPYHMGRFAIAGLGLQEHAAASHFEGLVTTLCGYCVIGVCLVVLHTLAALMGFHRSQQILGLCYVVVKVSLLSVVEIGVLPLVCGWWLDICSLAMFDATLRDREASFSMAPGTSMFIHWLAGIMYIYYFASFVLLLREFLRPGVLWFLRNLNDPDFSPIQEMIHLPILRHARRLVSSIVIFGTVILLMLWLPVKIVRWAWPGFLPYTVNVQNEAQVSELSLELLLLQAVLPALLEQSNTRTWLKAVVRAWCRVVAWMLDLRSYLLQDPSFDPGPAVVEEAHHQGLGVAHHALLQRGQGSSNFLPYVRPRWFPARLIALLVCVCITLVAVSLVMMTLPIWIGRRIMALWMVGAPAPSPLILLPDLSNNNGGENVSALSGRVHEVYTVACGTYLCWALAQGLALAFSWLPRGRRAILDRIKHWAVLGLKASVASILLVGVIPLLFGLLLELVVIIPLRIPLEQTPILFIWQDWALGVLYTKIATAVTMMGPESKLRLAIEKAYNDGIREMDLKFVVTELAAPVICCFGLALAVPYAMAYGILPLLVSNLQTQILIARRLYPFLLLVNVVFVVVSFQIRQFHKLYEHIKDDKYLVGKRLVNYEHRSKPQQQSPQQPQQQQST